MERIQRGMAAVLVGLALISTACSGPGSTSSPAASSPTDGSARATQSGAPAASPDESLFATDSSAPPPVAVRKVETSGGVSVSDVSFAAVPDHPTLAYLVAPSKPARRGPGIVYFHWLSGQPTSNRTEFLDEATSLAQAGVVSLLVQGTLPWSEEPSGVSHDLAGVQAEVRMLRRGLDLLIARPDVDPTRLAVVGHDFGAMYAADLAGVDARIHAAVLMTPTARWADWFAKYWAVDESDAAYAAGLAGVDPITWLPVAAARQLPLLLQFGETDGFVPEAVRSEMSAAAGDAAVVKAYAAGHNLEDQARADRDAFLGAQLGFTPPT